MNSKQEDFILEQGMEKKPKNKNQDEEIIEKVLKNIDDEYPSFLAHDEMCFGDKLGECRNNCLNELKSYLQKALSLQRKYFRDRIPNVEFQDGYNKAQEETKAKVEKLREEIFLIIRNYANLDWVVKKHIKDKIDEIFKETSEGGE